MAGDRIHGINVRGLIDLRGLSTPPPRSPSYEGRFGRLFRKLPPAAHPDGFLADLATRMREEAVRGNDPANDSAIPSGYTYLGQFIDHDVTFDPTSSLTRANDPDALVNFRTPRFDLDSVYGSGPADDAFLYRRGKGAAGLKLLVDRNAEDQDDDLPRNSEGRALLGDPRNDENTIVGQLHLAFVKAHNRALDEVAGMFPNDEETLNAAQRIVRWKYQWVVVHDYLKRILDPGTYDDLIRDDPTDPTDLFKLKFYRPKVNAYLPVEFSVAAFRFGHSMVRPSYTINDIVPELPLFKPGPAQPKEDFRGFKPLPGQWTIRWERFFDLGTITPQPSRKIDTHLADVLFHLPDESGDLQSLAHRNLVRGFRFGLPSGQAVAARIGATPLSAGDLGFDGDAPLWFYVLKEGEKVHDGEHLGPVGSRIVGETLLGLLEIDPLSYVSAGGGWPAFLPEPPPDFTMADFLRWAVPDQT